MRPGEIHLGAWNVINSNTLERGFSERSEIRFSLPLSLRMFLGTPSLARGYAA